MAGLGDYSIRRLALNLAKQERDEAIARQRAANSARISSALLSMPQTLINSGLQVSQFADDKSVADQDRIIKLAQMSSDVGDTVDESKVEDPFQPLIKPEVPAIQKVEKAVPLNTKGDAEFLPAVRHPDAPPLESRNKLAGSGELPPDFGLKMRVEPLQPQRLLKTGNSVLDDLVLGKAPKAQFRSLGFDEQTPLDKEIALRKASIESGFDPGEKAPDETGAVDLDALSPSSDLRGPPKELIGKLLSDELKLNMPDSMFKYPEGQLKSPEVSANGNLGDSMYPDMDQYPADKSSYVSGTPRGMLPNQFISSTNHPKASIPTDEPEELTAEQIKAKLGNRGPTGPGGPVQEGVQIDSKAQSNKRRAELKAAGKSDLEINKIITDEFGDSRAKGTIDIGNALSDKKPEGSGGGNKRLDADTENLEPDAAESDDEESVGGGTPIVKAANAVVKPIVAAEVAKQASEGYQKTKYFADPKGVAKDIVDTIMKDKPKDNPLMNLLTWGQHNNRMEQTRAIAEKIVAKSVREQRAALEKQKFEQYKGEEELDLKRSGQNKAKNIANNFRQELEQGISSDDLVQSSFKKGLELAKNGRLPVSKARELAKAWAIWAASDVRARSLSGAGGVGVGGIGNASRSNGVSEGAAELDADKFNDAYNKLDKAGMAPDELAFLRSLKQAVQQAGKAREGGRMTDADLQFYLENLVSVESPQAMMESLAEMQQYNAKKYNRSFDSAKRQNLIGVEGYPTLDVLDDSWNKDIDWSKTSSLPSLDAERASNNRAGNAPAELAGPLKIASIIDDTKAAGKGIKDVVEPLFKPDAASEARKDSASKDDPEFNRMGVTIKRLETKGVNDAEKAIAAGDPKKALVILGELDVSTKKSRDYMSSREKEKEAIKQGTSIHALDNKFDPGRLDNLKPSFDQFGPGDRARIVKEMDMFLDRAVGFDDGEIQDKLQAILEKNIRQLGVKPVGRQKFSEPPMDSANKSIDDVVEYSPEIQKRIDAIYKKIAKLQSVQ